MRLLLILFFIPALSLSQDYGFDGTWPGTYFCPSDSGKITLEIYFQETKYKYSCSLAGASQKQECFLYENKMMVLVGGHILFELENKEDNLVTRWFMPGNNYSFYPEPMLECYYE